MLYFSLAQNCIDYNKLYIGQLPLSITEPFIRDVLSKFTEVKDVRYSFFYFFRIIKGDARGTFDRFCYAFSMIKGNDEICSQVIKKVNEQYPEWKLNVKVDNDRFKFMQQPQQNNPRQGNQGGNFPHHGHQNQNHGEMNYERKSHQQDYY
jgi:RNA recognition motif-containing protein